MKTYSLPLRPGSGTPRQLHEQLQSAHPRSTILQPHWSPRSPRQSNYLHPRLAFPPTATVGSPVTYTYSAPKSAASGEPPIVVPSLSRYGRKNNASSRAPSEQPKGPHSANDSSRPPTRKRCGSLPSSATAATSSARSPPFETPPASASHPWEDKEVVLADKFILAPNNQPLRLPATISRPRSAPAPEQWQQPFTVDEIKRKISKAKRWSAPGPDGISWSHLKILTRALAGLPDHPRDPLQRMPILRQPPPDML